MVFRFLDLPAELRNRVYDFASFVDKPVRISNEKRTYFSTTRHIQGIALTQVCRQIRSEYLPMLRQNSRIEVACHHVVEYLKVFHLTSSECDVLPAPADLRIRYCAGHCNSLRVTCELAFDMLPLLQASLDLSKQNMHFVPRRKGANAAKIRSLNQVFHVENASWKDSLRAGNLDSITFGNWGTEKDLAIFFNAIDEPAPSVYGVIDWEVVMKNYGFDWDLGSGFYKIMVGLKGNFWGFTGAHRF